MSRIPIGNPHVNQSTQSGRRVKRDITTFIEPERLAGLALAILLSISAVPGRAVHIVQALAAVFLVMLSRGAALNSITSFTVILPCILFYLIGMLNSGGEVYYQNIQDALGVLIGLVSPLLIGSLPKARALSMLRSYSRLALMITTVISCVGIYKFVLLLNGQMFAPVLLLSESTNVYYPNGTSLVSDYNFFSLSLVTGVVAWFYVVSDRDSHDPKWRLLITFCLPVLLTGIIFAGSRRGWTVIGGLAIYSVWVTVWSYLRRRSIDRPVPQMRAPVAISVITGLSLGALLAVFASYVGSIDVDNVGAVEALIGRFETISGERATYSDSFSDRTDFWTFGLKVMANEYSIQQIVFGDGFGYLKVYAKQFPAYGVAELYPHNPVLSAFHYSGVVGGVYVAAVLLGTFVRALMLRASLGNHLVNLYVVTIVYCLPSGNSMFSYYFLVLLIVLIWECELPPLSRGFCKPLCVSTT